MTQNRYRSIGYEVADVEVKTNSDARIDVLKKDRRYDGNNGDPDLELGKKAESISKDALIEQIMGALLDKTPAEVREYIKSLKKVA